ncbi:3-oxoacyl-[acyl-carrier-protein] reductase [Pseudobacter ginsenosidimutans]|uniref:3-oxoacyl-[acyl-carrier-protein] reductase n=1 Tax=Pseudobacter ginsenosidimutans TaxID=661488 RepID=A0A4Q7MSY7_9BACT|nr:3-oxoacyl-[acyl-carrier-protein] reductase [Pseudobacter ginsenosidimutans]QEC41610.1 3-oxoacyl-[acyl-carrier-protein] reductase [Pseudobacter ginsenosidimutans]RZS71598.1 3-oxoacyl-[acyl-carrier-protein] reductase [Pseudobacter ginsenosidimutans]
MKLLDNKVAIVTGAARGIGEAIAVKLAEHGASIAFTYVSDSSADKAAALQQKLESLGVKAKAYKSNAGDFAASEQFVNDVVKEFGTIDVCVNNAGISKDNLLLRMTPEQWDDVMNINLKSVFNITKQVIRPMMKAKKGSIINMSSIIGIRGNAGQASYAASKAGIIGFTKSIAHELGSRNIRCNAIAPGFIETDMTHYLQDGDASKAFLEKIPLGRFGSGEEIANTTLFLASDMSTYITGQVLSVCGGLNI